MMRGQCLCGAVRFEAAEVETEFGACHCDMCRRWGTGPLMAAESRGVRFEGAENVATFASSPGVERGFCRICGSNLFFRDTEAPEGVYELSVGAFDDAGHLRLAREIYVDRQPPSYRFAGTETRLTEAECRAQASAPE